MFPNIKQPEEIAVRMNGMWFNSLRQLITDEQLQDMLRNEKELFIKQATESDGGQGVFYYRFGEDFDEIIKKIKGDIIIQKKIKQKYLSGTFETNLMLSRSLFLHLPDM